jgi:hypothetical protein
VAGANWASSTELEVAGVSALVTRVLHEQEVAPSAIVVICLNAAQACILLLT